MDITTTETLLFTAAAVGFLHTLMGPDHFLPFIAMSRAGGWSLRKTAVVTTACGIGHVLSSVVLGLLGLALGVAVARLVAIEEFRGDVAGWLLLGFGLAYMVWGLRRAWRNSPHVHVHVQSDGMLDYRAHAHGTIDPALASTAALAQATSDESPYRSPSHQGPPMAQAAPQATSVVTPWLLFLIFIFGPCEPLIPLLMYPAAKANLMVSVLVATVFGVVTLATMLSMVVAGYFGLARLASGALDRYAHAACGGAIAMCGAAVCLGL